jgi:DNA-binding NtrC family response regulator
MRRPWILFVEDDPDTLDVFIDALSEAGFLVTGVPSVEEALLLLRGGAPPCAVICDVLLPTGSGVDLVVAMQADSALQSIPVTLVSGLLPIALPAGVKVAATLSKPFSMEDVIALLEQQCPPGARVI